MAEIAALVIDDESEYNRVVRDVLQRFGFRVRSALDGASAVFSAKRDLPDLILLDIMMPELDGLSTVRRLRADPALASTPVVVISALVGDEDRRAALAAGADAFLGKPFTLGELKDAIAPFVAVTSHQATISPDAPRAA